VCFASAASKSHDTEQGVVVCSASAASRSHGHDQKPNAPHKDERNKCGCVGDFFTIQHQMGVLIRFVHCKFHSLCTIGRTRRMACRDIHHRRLFLQVVVSVILSLFCEIFRRNFCKIASVLPYRLFTIRMGNLWAVLQCRICALRCT